MNRDMYKQMLRIEILKALNDCGSYMLQENVLKNQLALMVSPAPTLAETETEIRYLEEHNYVKGVRPELGGPTKWKITDEGRSLL